MKIRLKYNILYIFIFILAHYSCTKNNSTIETKNDWRNHEDKLKAIDKKLQELSTEIKSIMGNGACKNDSQCKVLGLGAKSCGGYSNFIIFSILDAPEAKITTLVDEFNSEETVS